MKTNINQEHHYALSEAGVLTHIKDAYNSVEDFFCPHCKCRMIKKCGQIRQWHFAHDWRIADDQQKQCTYETYLHSYAKMRVEQWFKESKKITIHYTAQNCCKLYDRCHIRTPHVDLCSSYKEKRFDLKNSLNSCDIEKKITIDGLSFKPDLIWYNDQSPQNNYIFIEIKVTHGCSKTKKNSKARIIEFEVHSEEDVDKIVSNDISENDYTHFWGFSTKFFDPKDEIKPSYNLSKFILYKSGKCIVTKTNCQNFNHRKPDSIFELTVNEYNNYIAADSKTYTCNYFFYGLVIAKLNGFEIKNCFLCTHKKFNENGTCTCLKLNNEITNSNQAVECNHFEFNDASYSKAKENPFEYNIIDIWPK